MAFPAVFAILVGVGMIGQWTASFIGKQIPELQSEPIRIWFHIAAEMATAICLIMGGIGLLMAQSWGIPLYLISSGMLFLYRHCQPGILCAKRTMGLAAHVWRDSHSWRFRYFLRSLKTIQ